ncbi:MAG: hypothetical protein KDA28_05400, partial [Phycisphaerales bacterium]|nr:hypothetical protein [Phycisphaerales bacterium]
LLPEDAHEACLRATSIRAMASGVLDLVEYPDRRRDLGALLRTRNAPSADAFATVAWGGL